MKFVALLLLFLVSSQAPGRSNFLSSYYEQALNAQNNGTYTDFLQTIASNESLSDIRDQLVKAFENLKSFSPAERQEEMTNLLMYYSSANGVYKQNALDLESKAGYSMQELVSGQYDSTSLTNNLLSTVLDFETSVTYPIALDIEREIQSSHSNQIVLFIGRDFTSVYIVMRNRGVVRNHLAMANFSRDIKDRIFSGQEADAYTLLASMGVTKEQVLARGLLILDSSMKGKIPKSILKALSYHMTDSEAYDLVTQRVEIKYVKSKKVKQPDLRTQAQNLRQAHGRFDSSIRDILFDENQPVSIPRLRFQPPVAMQNYNVDDSPHHFFEHRLKPVRSAEKIVARGGRVSLYSPTPRSSSEVIHSLLGFAADIKLHGLSLGVNYSVPKPTRKESSSKTSIVSHRSDHSGDLQSSLAEIEAIYINSGSNEELVYKQLRNWQDSVRPSAAARHPLLVLEPSRKTGVEYVLKFNGEVIYELKKFLSQGRNGLVFLTKQGTALKIAREPHNCSRNLLQAWMAQKLKGYGLSLVDILNADPDGLFLEMEYIEGEELQYDYPLKNRAIPSSLQEQIKAEWKKAKRVAEDLNLWLDFKAANYHINSRGQIVLVDFPPRLNKGRKTYFQNEDGRWLDTADMLDEFTFHEIRNDNTKKMPGQRCSFVFGGQEF